MQQISEAQKTWKTTTFYKVPNVLRALQEVVVLYRKKFDYPIIGITGSNGKTIVKGWLYPQFTHITTTLSTL